MNLLLIHVTRVEGAEYAPFVMSASADRLATGDRRRGSPWLSGDVIQPGALRRVTLRTLKIEKLHILRKACAPQLLDLFLRGNVIAEETVLMSRVGDNGVLAGVLVPREST
jgi:hypothetical protein